jgi:hypothetical protein
VKRKKAEAIRTQLVILATEPTEPSESAVVDAELAVVGLVEVPALVAEPVVGTV